MNKARIRARTEARMVASMEASMEAMLASMEAANTKLLQMQHLMSESSRDQLAEATANLEKLRKSRRAR